MEILWENDEYAAFNKPSGLLSVPDRFDASLPNLFHEVQRKGAKLWMVHRLDRDTSGVICFAKNESAHRHLSQLFQKREVAKFYRAIVHGRPSSDSDSLHFALEESTTQKGRMVVRKKGKPAHTDYLVEKRWSSYSLLRLQIFTGRTHQIRVHCAHIGHPIVCDPVYGSEEALFLSSIKRKYRLGKHQEEERPLLGRLALHASDLRFLDERGQEIAVGAPFPKDLRAVAAQLDKWNF